ncbi:hypothetical protein V6N12_019260 [Hibiscus sabdariffa]|uniref:Uncharacterized protein n=1 Tax=Hibiscus sabdariffa TaxID=183260 RepID=A0ABR2C711_9ROSI
MTGLFVGSLRGVVLTARASRWPILFVGLVVWLIIVDWQLGAGPTIATSTSFSCCSSFHPTWCASLLLVPRFTCPRSTTGLAAGSACGIDLVAQPFRWPILGVGLAAYPVVGLLGFGQMLGAAPVVAWFHLLWHASLALVLWFTCPRSVTGLPTSSMCGAVLAARPLRWQILGVEFAACPTAWMLVFERFSSLARPPSWLFTWPDAKASMCLLQYERLPLFCLGCGLICHSVLACPTTLKVEGQKFQYGAWLRAPLPKRSATRPRGWLSVVDDDLDAPVTVDTAAEGPSTRPGSNGTNSSASAPEPVVPIVVASVTRTPSPAAASIANNLPDSSAPSGMPTWCRKRLMRLPRNRLFGASC